jgi:hypothetical protein
MQSQVFNMQPKILKGFFEPRILGLLQYQVNLIKRSSCDADNEIFHRKQFHNHPMLKVLHEQMTKEASEIFEEELKPSYVFLSMYFEGKGNCPLHVDRPQCYRTIDLCINQKRPWGIFVNSKMNWDEDKKEEMMQSADEYILSPGDALAYSGTQNPHFRKPMKEIPEQADNFVDLAFFHFVPKNFEGTLS